MDKRTMIVVWKWDLQWTVDNGEVKKSWEHHDFIGCKSRFEIGVEGDESEAYTFIGFTKRKDCLDNELTLTENRPSYTEDGIIDECNKHLKDKNKVLLLLHAGRDDNFTKKSHVYKELKNKDNIFVDFF